MTARNNGKAMIKRERAVRNEDNKSVCMQSEKARQVRVVRGEERLSTRFWYYHDLSCLSTKTEGRRLAVAAKDDLLAGGDGGDALAVRVVAE